MSKKVVSIGESARNTTVRALHAGEEFIGEQEFNSTRDVMVSCKSDTAGTIFFEFSVDGQNWEVYPSYGFEVNANEHFLKVVQKGPMHFRVRYVNGENDQTYFRLYTYYGSFRSANMDFGEGASIEDDWEEFYRPTKREVVIDYLKSMASDYLFWLLLLIASGVWFK